MRIPHPPSTSSPLSSTERIDARSSSATAGRASAGRPSGSSRTAWTSAPSPTGAHRAPVRTGARGGVPAGAGRPREAVPGVERVRALAQRLEPRRRIDEVVDVAGRSAEVLGGEPDPGVAREHARAVAESRGVGRRTVVEPGVDHRARELRVVRPRPAVEVVGADGHPHVVDDAHLRVHVDRACPRCSRGRTPRRVRGRPRAARRARAHGRCGSRHRRPRRRDPGSGGPRPRSGARDCAPALRAAPRWRPSDHRYWSSR